MSRSDPVREVVRKHLSRGSYASVCNDRRWIKIIEALKGKNVRVKHYAEESATDLCRIWSPALYYAETSRSTPFHVIEIEWIETDRDERLALDLLIRKAAISISGENMRIWGHVKPGNAPTFVTGNVV